MTRHRLTENTLIAADRELAGAEISASALLGAACASLSVTVEMLQLGLGRSVDVDDVLLNTLGGALGAAAGAAVAAWLRRRYPPSPNANEAEVESP